MPKKEIDHWMKNYENKVFTDYNKYPNRKTITISKEKYISNSFTWYWYPGGETDENREFMGEMNCTPEEIEIYLDNIEREKNIKKYNV